MKMKKIMEAERDEFQDTIWRDMEARKNIAYYDIGELVDYPLFPKVFNPIAAKASLFFLKNLGVQKTDMVLDPFTGCGVDAVCAGLKTMGKVIASDNFLPAYKNAVFAVKRFGLENKIEVRYGGLFSQIHESNSFSLILANPPFRSDKKPRTRSENALRDEDYATLEKFWRKGKRYLKLSSSSRIRMVFSDVGDMNYNEQLMKNNGFDFTVVARSIYASSIRIYVYEAKPR